MTGGGATVADEPTATEVGAQLRALVAQTHALVNDIDGVVDTLHDHTESMHRADAAFERPEDDRG